MDRLKKVFNRLRSGYLRDAVRELRWVYASAYTYRKKIIGYTLLTMITAGFNIGLSLLYRPLIDSLIISDWHSVIMTAVVFVVIAALNIIVTSVANRMAGRINAVVKKDLAAKSYAAVMEADWETVIRHHSGDLMTRVQEDVTTVSQSTSGWIPMTLYQAVKIIIAFAVIIWFDPMLIVLVFLLAPIVLFASRPFLRRQYESNRKERVISSGVMTLYKESFHHLQSIKGFGRIGFFERRMDEKLADRQDIEIEVSKNSVASWLVMYSSGALAAVVCLCWTALRVYQGRISIGTMAMLTTLATTTAESFKAVVQQVTPAINTISASERLRNIISLPKEKLENESDYDELLREAKEKGASVEIKDLSFSYANGTQVLCGVNCEIAAGKIVALVGPSGEGKTTMLRILLGIVRAEHEPVIRAGEKVLPVSPAARRLMAYVPQGNSVMTGTIAENMRMFRQDATDGEIVSALKEACAWDFVEKLPDGIYQNIGESGIGFSEGQNQRLAIARALLYNTPVLLLDEATSALDVATERRVLDNLMKGAAKRTCILTTHRPSVLSMCDKVYRIADRKVREIDEEEIRQLMNEF